MTILPSSTVEAEQAAQIRAILKSQGQPIGALAAIVQTVEGIGEGLLALTTQVALAPLACSAMTMGFGMVTEGTLQG